MGRTGKWLRSLFSTSGSKKPLPVKSKKKFSAGEDSSANNPYAETQLDANKHAIAVAAATAAVAEAALAAAQAAAEVVRLTSGGGGGSGRNEPVAYVSGDRRRVVAAVKIQSAFRAYLARRALKALKGLVKLQALVRGHIVRKQSADMLRRMQAMARIQARASAHRSYITEPTNKFNYSRHPAPQGITNRRNYDEHSNYAKQGAYIHKRYNPRLQSNGNESSQQTSNWLHHWMDQYTLNNRHEDERTDKILEIDTWKPRQPARQTEGTTIPTHQYFSWNEAARLSAKLQKPNPSISSEEVSSALSSKCPPEGDQGAVRTAENSPRVQSATSRQSRGTFTPTKSECSRSYFGDYLSHPSYMANTASSRAKVRSQSAPKQRMQLEELGMNHGLWEPDTNSETGFYLQGNYRNNTMYLHYPGQLRRQATPTRGTYAGLSSTYGHGI